MKLKEELKKLCKQYDVLLLFERIPKSENNIAYCDSAYSITFDYYLKNNRTEALCAFFHELGHVMCNRTGKWKIYHDYDPNNTNDKKILRRLVYTSLKAERWVDNFAARELAKYDKRIKYDFPYSQIGITKSFIDSFVKPAKIKILKNKK